MEFEEMCKFKILTLRWHCYEEEWKEKHCNSHGKREWFVWLLIASMLCTRFYTYEDCINVKGQNGSIVAIFYWRKYTREVFSNAELLFQTGVWNEPIWYGWSSDTLTSYFCWKFIDDSLRIEGKWGKKNDGMGAFCLKDKGDSVG